MEQTLARCSESKSVGEPEDLFRRHLDLVKHQVRNGEGVTDSGRFELSEHMQNNPNRQLKFELNVRRKTLTKQYAWAIPNRRALGLLYYNDPILEIGAGLGYWAHCLRQMGASVRAFDWYADERESWTHVEQGGPEVIPSYPDHTLFLCWPPYDEPMARECLEYYTGDRLIYIGEEMGGCTGDMAFHHRLDENFECVEQFVIRSFPYVHDSLYVFDRQ